MSKSSSKKIYKVLDRLAAHLERTTGGYTSNILFRLNFNLTVVGNLVQQRYKLI